MTNTGSLRHFITAQKNRYEAPYGGRDMPACAVELTYITIYSMKNTWIYLVIIVLFLGLSFSIYQNVKDSHTSETNSQITEKKIETSENISFAQKQECAQYRSIIEAKLKDEYEWSDEEGEAYAELDEIWYSQNLDSCLYSFKQTTFAPKDTLVAKGYSIYDYTSNKNLFGATDANNSNALKLFEAKKLELK